MHLGVRHDVICQILTCFIPDRDEGSKFGHLIEFSDDEHYHQRFAMINA